MASLSEGRMWLNDKQPVPVFLNSTVYLPNIPTKVIWSGGVRPALPMGLEVLQWKKHFVWLKVDGTAPKLLVYIDYSATGYVLSDFALSAQPILSINAAGSYVANLGVPDHAYAMLRLVGDVANGPNTTALVVLGGE